MLYESDYLMHYGVKGQKWGVRRYQEVSGELTAEGKLRYEQARKERIKNIGLIRGSKNPAKAFANIIKKPKEKNHKRVSKMTDDELKKKIERLKQEREYKQLKSEMKTKKDKDYDLQNKVNKAELENRYRVATSFSTKHPILKKVMLEPMQDVAKKVVGQTLKSLFPDRNKDDNSNNNGGGKKEKNKDKDNKNYSLIEENKLSDHQKRKLDWFSEQYDSDNWYADDNAYSEYAKSDPGFKYMGKKERRKKIKDTWTAGESSGWWVD